MFPRSDRNFRTGSRTVARKGAAPVLDAPAGRSDDFVDPYFKQAKFDEVVTGFQPEHFSKLQQALRLATSCDLQPTNLLPIFAYGGVGIVPIISPGRVTKMDDEITVVRGHTIAETDLANGLPVSNGLPLTFGKENKP